MWVGEDSDKRELYTIGRVIETIKSSDGIIRSATVQAKEAVYWRPNVRLASILPIDEDVVLKK